MRKQLSRWLVVGAALCVPALAHAEDEPKAYPECTKAPTDAETAAAKGAYQAGNASFDEADYPRAITYWEDAYRRDCTANLLLKNLARAYELYGQKRQAVVALETFLVREPGSGDKEQIQRRIEVLKKQIAAEKSAPAVTPNAQTTGPVTPVNEPAQPVEQPTGHTGKRPILPLFVVGGGAVLTVVGLVVYSKAAKDVDNYKALCAFSDADGQYHCGSGNDEVANQANAAQNRKVVGGVVAGVGVAAIAGGLIWYFVQPRSAETVGTLLKPRVSPALTPGYAGLALSGAF
jgi:tetratricopeptide (TPR) repeat protein